MGQKVAIIFYSATGNTEAMAEAVAVGAKKAGADVLLAPVSDVDRQHLPSDHFGLFGLGGGGYRRGTDEALL